MRRFFVIASAALFLGTQAFAKSDPDTYGDKSAKPAAAKEKGKGKAKKKDKPFADAVKDLEKIEGLFTFYTDVDEGKYLMSIKADQLDELFLCSMTRSAGDGTFFDSSSMMNDFPFVFKRVGKKVQFIHKNVYFRANEDAAISRALKRGVSDSIVGSTEIVSDPDDSGTVLVDASKLFITDVGRVTERFGRAKGGAKYKWDKGNSYFGTIKSFAQNSEIDVVLHYTSGKPGVAPTLADARSFLHTYHYSLGSIPESSYKPRLEDDRVGYFTTIHQDYTSVLSETAYVRQINRWHLVKAEPKMELSPPLKPIVYWLENTIPVEYREAVTEGILLWNDAFEKIGFKDAVVVKQQPDDAEWDPADARYSTIRWIVQPGGGYAVGPSRTNPFTGQLYDADIRISADIVRSAFLNYDMAIEPVVGIEKVEELPISPGRMSTRLCNYAEGLAEQGAFAWSLIQARGEMHPQSPEGEKFVKEFLTDIVAHEVGHTLGLRHNFKGTQINSTVDLQNMSTTHRNGVSSSVMDYTPVNLAPTGGTQGEYWQTTLGPYDYWAIEYGYRQFDPDNPGGEKAALDKIASRGSERELQYATDEDAFFGARGMDPTATRWDLGSDTIAYYRDRAELADELWSKMETAFEVDGEHYYKLRRVFGRGIGQIRIGVWNVTKYIGGIYHHRDHVGDPNGRIPFEPVPAARQREALDFLTDKVFSTKSFDFDADLLNKLGVNRQWDFTGAVWQVRRIDYPIHDIVLSLQTSALNHLYDPVMLDRLVDSELRFQTGADTFTMAILFDELHRSIWSELDAGANISSFRRALQRQHLKRVINLVTKPNPQTPADASALARANLIALDAAIGSTSGTSQDAYTSAHLGESQAMIRAALKAGLDRSISN